MDFLQSGQALFQNLRYWRDQAQGQGAPDMISTIADQIVNFLLPSSSSSSAHSTMNDIRRDYLEPYILSPLESLLNSGSSGTAAGSMPSLISLLTLAVVAFVSFKLLDYVRRVVMWWIMLAFKLCLLLLVVQVGWYVSQYGWEKTLSDAGWVWGIVEGFVGETGAQAQGSTNGRRDTTGSRTGGRQQVPLSNANGQRRRW